MPAAAVIPAPIVYIKVAAVKKLVVGVWGGWAVAPFAFSGGWPIFACPPVFSWGARLPFIGWVWGARTFTLKKLECSKQA